jgi:3-hydroxybutyryl-CoA dehydrogenase
MTAIKNVTVIGLGTLGSQIAMQAAAYGHRVTAFDPNPDAFAQARGKVRSAMQMVGKGPTYPIERWDDIAAQVHLTGDLASAAQNADLVVEVVAENVELKRKVFAELDRAAPPAAVLATNSSSIPVSRIESATQRPQLCLNLHFYQPAVGMPMADIMGGTRTAPETIVAARDFLRAIQCVPLPVQKEILGFCFNNVWRAVKRQTLYMWAGGFVDFRDIDRAWMVFTGMTYGPFFLMDLVGLDVVLAIENVYFAESGDAKDAPPQALKDKVAKGELGIKSGRGFYSYPDPECARPGFLQGR